MRAIFGLPKSNCGHPLINEAGILTCAHVSGSGDRFITELPQDTFQGHELEPSDSLRAEFSADLPNATLVGCYFDNWPESRDLTAEPNLDGLGPRANGTFGPDGPQIRLGTPSLGVPFVQAHG